MAATVAPADLDSLLAACLSNDTQAIKAAEAALKRLTASAALLPELLSRVVACPSPEVRQLSAVLLRKAVTKHWTKLGDADRAHMQAVLLDRLVAEPTHPVRRSLGHLVGVVARHAVPRGQWPGLLEFLGQCSASGDAGHREVALSLLGSLAEHVGEHLSTHVATMQQMVGAGLRDASLEVRRAAVQVLEPLAALTAGCGAPQVEAFHGLVAVLLEVSSVAHTSRDDETLTLTLQLFVELCEASAPLLGRHLPAVVGLAMSVATDPRAELSTRESALEVVHWVARFKPKQLGRNKELVRQIVTALCTMAAEPAPPDLDPEDDGTLPPAKLATQALDAVALHLPATSIFPSVLSFCREAIASAQPAHREAALTALAVIFEGCAEPLRKRLKDVMPLLLAGLQDSAASVRGAAAFALGMAAEFLQPDVVEYYKEVLPLLFPLMAEGNADLCERTCYALDTFCEALEGSEIVPYLQQLISGLVTVLNVTGPAVQELAMSALASVVAAAGKEFEPYLGVILPVLHHFMSSTSAALLSCRYRATETAGLLFEGLGSSNEQLRGLVPALMELALQGFKMESTELREYGHGMFACIAKALGAEFLPYLHVCIPLALASISQDDGVFDGPDGDDEEEEEEEDDEETETRREQPLNVRTGVLDEKCAATSALGLYAQAAPAAFLPFVERALAGMVSMCRQVYFHEEVRIQAAEALSRLVLSVYAACPPPAGATGAAAITPEVRHVLDAATKELSRALDDYDAVVVIAGLQALTVLLRHLGVEALGPELLERIASTATAICKGEAVCQKAPDDEEEDGDGSDEEDDRSGAEELLAAVAELLPVLAMAVGPATYAPVFASAHAPALLTRLRPQQPDDVRSVVVGGLAEVAEVLQAHMAAHLPALMPLLLRELRCSEPINRQNAAFCCGVLAAGCGGAAMAQFYPKLLQTLHPLFAVGENDGVRDNALGCVSRMMTADGGAAAAGLPLEAVLPVFLGALPLKEDLKEAPAVYGAMCGLLTGDQAPRVAALVPQVVAAFGAAAVQQPALPMAVVVQIARTLATLSQQYPVAMAPLVTALPAAQRAALEAAAI
ncbi:putative importin subunit beta-4 [Tetrabaena socialis]|uniref:Putative importin subunit beta-4 n=1 Tax=Tetrabaena socialis TaxID=47790 RepID=A0A2J7ZXH1_9CHLO|nr:putative importin subunit beta-4 [Tetrabaena socialis]|eukprot:PNH04952.1 putative importin subunit beta-4 [Tetrabaena socialis]